jgi:hypothetical protein
LPGHGLLLILSGLPNFQLVILSEPLFCLAKDLGAPREASAFFADA